MSTIFKFPNSVNTLRTSSDERLSKTVITSASFIIGLITLSLTTLNESLTTSISFLIAIFSSTATNVNTLSNIAQSSSVPLENLTLNSFPHKVLRYISVQGFKLFICIFVILSPDNSNTSVPKLIFKTSVSLDSVSCKKSAALSAIENTPDRGIHIIKYMNNIFTTPIAPPIKRFFFVLTFLPNLSYFFGLINL